MARVDVEGLHTFGGGDGDDRIAVGAAVALAGLLDAPAAVGRAAQSRSVVADAAAGLCPALLAVHDRTSACCWQSSRCPWICDVIAAPVAAAGNRRRDELLGGVPIALRVSICVRDIRDIRDISE